MTLAATFNVSDPQKRAAVEKCLKDAQFKAQTRQLRPDTLSNFLRNYDSQLRRDGFTTPELQKLTPHLRDSLESLILRAADPGGPGAMRQSARERWCTWFEQKYQNQPLRFSTLVSICRDFQSTLREHGLPAGQFFEVCEDLQEEFARRAAHTETAALPNSLGALVSRWIERRNQLGALSEFPVALAAADVELRRGALEGLKRAELGSITPLNIAERWQVLTAGLHGLPEQTRERAKSLIFWRLLNAAVPNADSDLWWLASLIFAEAGSQKEPFEGKLAVGWVVMNWLGAQSETNWTGYTGFGKTIKDIIRKPGQFEAYHPRDEKWQRAMEYHENPEIHRTAKRPKVNTSEVSDADRGQLLESLRAAYLSMKRSGTDPTVGGFDGLSATFFQPTFNESKHGTAKHSLNDLATNDFKKRIGGHDFWDRSLEWWWCDWRARRLPPGVALPEVCYPILQRRTPMNVEFLPEGDIVKGVEEINFRQKRRR